MGPTNGSSEGQLHGNNEEQPDIFMPYQKLYIYHTKFCFLIVGYCRVRKRYALLEIVRQDGQDLQARERVCSCNLGEINTILRQAHVDTQDVGGLQFVTKAYGIIGCIRFTSGFYLLIVTRKAHMGSIRGHKVYRVDGVALLPLGAAAGVSQQQDTPEERRYRKLLMGVDLTKGFYFSFTYHLAATLQYNYQAGLAGAYAAAAASTSSQKQGQFSSSGPGPGFASSAFSSADFDSMFVWNSFLTRALRGALNSNLWVVALVHGFWDQRQLSVFGRPMTLTVLARRSRHFAGTRFKKRGISDQGKVANEVETEQILDAGIDYRTGLPLISSLVQLRGSVPLYWSQQTSALSPKPEIILQNFDPMFEATALHFADLRARYGDPLIVLNLLKSHERRPREKLLRQELATAIKLLNSKAPPHQQAVYIPWDFQHHAKQAGAGLLTEISAITRMSLDATGLFVHSPQKLHSSGFAGPASLLGITGMGRDGSSSLAGLPGVAGTPAHSTAALVAPARRTSQSLQAVGSSRRSTMHSCAGDGTEVINSQDEPSSIASAWPPYCAFQHGVLRTNCIDCLDRTNVAQFAFGLVGFGRQLFMLGLSDSEEIDSDSSIAFMLMEQYELMGNTLALQYGGSDAHSVFFQRQKGEWEASTRGKDFLTSVRRFYSNAYTDADKQDAINLFLGNYVPGLPGQPELWELESDVYLHSADPRTAAAAAASTHADPRPAATPPALPLPKPISTTHRISSAGSGSLDLKESMPFAPAVEVSAAATAAAATAACKDNQEAVQKAAVGGVPCLGGSWNLGRSILPALAHVSSDEDSPTAASAPARHQSLFDPSSFFRPGHDEDETCGRLNSRSSMSSSTGMRLPGISAGKGSSSSSWGISSIIASLFKSQPGPPLGVPNFQDDAHTLVAFDTLLSQPCRRAAPVRIHGTRSGQGSNLMWQAVQQAFAFYWTRQAVEEAAGMGADPSQINSAAMRAAGQPSGTLSPPYRDPSLHRNSSGGLLSIGSPAAPDEDEPSSGGRGLKRSSSSSAIALGRGAGSAVEALMRLGQELEASDTAPQATKPPSGATASALDQLSNPHPVPLPHLAAARQRRLAATQPLPPLFQRHTAVPSIVMPSYPPAAPVTSSLSSTTVARRATNPDETASPSSSLTTPQYTRSPSALGPAWPSSVQSKPTHPKASLPISPSSLQAASPLTSPPSASTPHSTAFAHTRPRRNTANTSTSSRLAAQASPAPSHPYLLPPPPDHHSASSTRTQGVAPSPSVFAEGLWATWPAPCFSRGARGSGAGSHSRRSQLDPWPAPAQRNLSSSSGSSNTTFSGEGVAGTHARGHQGKAHAGSAGLYRNHSAQVLPLEQCTKQPQQHNRRSSSGQDALHAGKAAPAPGGGRDSGRHGVYRSGGGGSRHAHQQQPHAGTVLGLGGRCNSAKQLEGSSDDYGEPCPGGLFSEGTALFLRELKAAAAARKGSNLGSSTPAQGNVGDAALENSCFSGYGGLMPEARSWADMWYSMFAGGTTTRQLDALFGACAPLNGFQPYRGGYVGVAGSPLPPTAAAVAQGQRRAQAQAQLLQLLPRLPTRHKDTQRALTPITRFGTTQYGTIAPAPDSTKDVALPDDEIDGIGRPSWESTGDVRGTAGTGKSDVADGKEGEDREAAALALLQQLQGNTQKFRMIKRTPSGGFAGVEEVDVRALKHSHVSNMLEASQRLAPGRIVEALSGSTVRAKPGTSTMSQLNDFIEMGPSAQQHVSFQAAQAAARATANSHATVAAGNGVILQAPQAGSHAAGILVENLSKDVNRQQVGAVEGGANKSSESRGPGGGNSLQGFSVGMHTRQAQTSSVAPRVLQPPAASSTMPKQPQHFVANTPLGLAPAGGGKRGNAMDQPGGNPAAQTSSSSSSAAAGPRLHRVQTRGASQGVEVEAGQQQQQPEGEGDEDDKGLGFRLNRSLGGFIATGVSLAGLLLDELHDCGLQWDCCPWWIAKQEELQAGGLPAPSRASHYQAALLHSMVKDQGVWEDYLNYCECMGRLLTEWQNLHLKEYYSFHAPALVMPLKQLAGIVSSW